MALFNPGNGGGIPNTLTYRSSPYSDYMKSNINYQNAMFDPLKYDYYISAGKSPEEANMLATGAGDTQGFAEVFQNREVSPITHQQYFGNQQQPIQLYDPTMMRNLRGATNSGKQTKLQKRMMRF